MTDAPSRWQDIPCVLEKGDVLPISHRPCGITDIKLKIHIEILGHTDCTNFKTATTVCLQKWICWVAFAQRVAHHGILWVAIVYNVSINCNTPSSVRQREHSSLRPSPPRTQKVSWTPAQINVPSVPAGFVSGSPGWWGQARLCPTGAACGSVS